jgi:uncharacterized SAM-binding protein YcdF (DUF218 family)
MARIGASRPLRRILAIVSFLNPQPALSLVGAHALSSLMSVFPRSKKSQRASCMARLYQALLTPRGRSLVEIDRFGAEFETRFADRHGYASFVNTNQSISSVTASAGLISARGARSAAMP